MCHPGTSAGDRRELKNLYDGDVAWTDARRALHLQKEEGLTEGSCANGSFLWLNFYFNNYEYSKEASAIT
jgi:hypothetical protein